MAKPGSESDPLRVAVVGSGPAGFYAVQSLLKNAPALAVDMLDRLPTPFGLVRHGVAPDHQKIKSVTAVYHQLALDPRYRFFGNVCFGADVDLDFLSRHYHQVIFATGAQTDRRLRIPGEDLNGSHPATEFVAWYNGHPDFSHLTFDLDCESVVVVGVGNVAVDVARILCRSREELATTDIADYALDALAASRIRQVYLLGRRGPAQAAFTNPEIKELGALADAACSTLGDECVLDPFSRLAAEQDKATARKIEILQEYVGRVEPGKRKRLILRFLVSPVEIQGDAAGRVSGVRVVRNELYGGEGGALLSRSTDRFETLEAGLVFRSVGYRGVALPGLPFRDDWGIVPNAEGRVLDAIDGAPVRGLYVAGWIKRGPSGVIGTNKPDAAETVRSMLADLDGDGYFSPSEPHPAAVPAALAARGIRFVSYDDWQSLDAREIARGKSVGRPRVKFTNSKQMLDALAE